MKPATIEAIKALFDSKNPRALQGWGWLDKTLTMARYVETEKPKICLGIGIFGGRTMVPMALQCRDNGFGVVYGVDPWTNPAALEGEHKPEDSKWWGAVNLFSVMIKFMGQIEQLGLIDIAIPIRATSQAIAGIFPPESIDILDIDGNHSELASLRDIDLYYPKVRSGGLIWLDDTDGERWPTNQAAVRKLESLCTRVLVVSGTEGHCTLYRKP